MQSLPKPRHHRNRGKCAFDGAVLDSTFGAITNVGYPVDDGRKRIKLGNDKTSFTTELTVEGLFEDQLLAA